MTVAEWALALVVTGLAALTQGVVGIGFALVSVPILSLVDPRLAPVPQLLITIPLTVAMAWRERHGIDLAGVGWIIAGRFPGAAIGVVLLAIATGAALDIVIAIIVLAAVAIIASGYHVRRSPMTDFGAGVFAGTSGLVASIGGPPLALLYTGADGAVSRPSLAAVFAVGLTISITARALTGNIVPNDVRVAIVLFPAVVVGYLVSVRLKDRVDANQLRTAVLILSTLAAAGLILRAAM